MPSKQKAVENELNKPNKIVFKLVKNVLLSGLSEYMNGTHPMPPASVVELRSVAAIAADPVWNPTTGAYSAPGAMRHPLVCQFDMDAEFEIELDEMDPRPVEKPAGMPDAFHERLVEREFDRAITARNRAEELRRLLLHYAKGPNPSIAIVTDETNFLDMKPFLSDAEFERLKDSQHRERFVAGKL